MVLEKGIPGVSGLSYRHTHGTMVSLSGKITYALDDLRSLLFLKYVKCFGMR